MKLPVEKKHASRIFLLKKEVAFSAARECSVT